MLPKLNGLAPRIFYKEIYITITFATRNTNNLLAAFKDRDQTTPGPTQKARYNQTSAIY